MKYLRTQKIQGEIAARQNVSGGMEKSAILGSAAIAAFGHFGSNALGKASHTSSNLGHVMAHKGFQHGLLEQQIHPARQAAMKALVGPEALATYEAARMAGQQAVQRFPNPEVRNRWLKATYGLIDTEKAFDHTPVIDPIRDAIAHEFRGTAPTLEAKGHASRLYGKLIDGLSDSVQTGMETPAQNIAKSIGGVAPAAGVLGLDMLATGTPLGALGHFGVNGGRELGSRLFGDRFIQHEMAKGLAGEMHSPLKSKLLDYGISPALQDVRIEANNIRKALTPEAAAHLQKFVANADPKGIKQNLMALPATFNDAKNHEDIINTVMGDKLRQLDVARENIHGIPETFRNPAYHDDIINTVIGDKIRQGQAIRDNISGLKDTFTNPANHDGILNTVMGDKVDQARGAVDNIQGLKNTFTNPEYRSDIVNTLAGDHIRGAQAFKSRVSDGINDARTMYNDARMPAPKWEEGVAHGSGPFTGGSANQNGSLNVRTPDAVPVRKNVVGPQSTARAQTAPVRQAYPQVSQPAQQPSQSVPQAARSQASAARPQAPAAPAAAATSAGNAPMSRLLAAGGGAAVGGLGGAAVDTENRPRGAMLGAMSGAGAAAAGAHFLGR